MMPKIFLISFLFILLVLSNTVQSGLYSNIYKDVKPSVVFVQANNSQNEPLSQGTGFFIDKAGYIITNFHIID
jgi:S1-C subfamily serine protease